MSADDDDLTEVGGRLFDGEGRLRGRRLSTLTAIDGVPCAPSSPVLLHANGRLHRAELAGPLATSLGVIPRGTRVFFDDTGRLVRLELRETCTLATRTFGPGSQVELPRDGAPRSASVDRSRSR